MVSKKKPLLVPLDGSSPAAEPLQVAEAVAETRNNDIHVLFVSSKPLSLMEVRARLRVPARWLERIKLHNAVGEPEEEIPRVAKALDADAIIMSTHGISRRHEEMAGHVTLRVLQDPPCPVYVLRSALDSATQAHRLRHLRRIVVPLDGSTAASRSLAEACVLAASASAHLTMLHVINTLPEEGRAPASPVFFDHPRYELEAWEDEFVRSSFAFGIEKVPDHLTVVLRVGDPAEEILRYAAEADADLIVPCCRGLFTPGHARVVSSLLCRANAPLLFVISRQVAAEGADNLESEAYVA